MNKQNVKRTATVHQYYSILASRDSTGFSFSNPTTFVEPEATTRCTTRCDQQIQTTQSSSPTLLTHTIPLTHHNRFYSKSTTNTTGMSQDEIRKLYDKAWEWFKEPISIQPNQNTIKK
ncbi:predicted protein [Naegleria gruberi]|uniref:Predicted protein n=1 Tax=Naegleria gruberi TaxID=5762 RepID=D2VNG2_NAEGR|nr:uncharacterized protein NAEGRDRAFT_70487 [Naegleria gruberi]EFC41654.1 predicted protein [Naegleria gruberi]|eukprot:XP_002674398.1 predicted protein [Naegleria gruberi strain NEG-M]